MKIQSSTVSTLRYSATSRNLRATFVRKSAATHRAGYRPNLAVTYIYRDVPPSVWASILGVIERGESIGTYFHRNIRDKYTTVKREVAMPIRDHAGRFTTEAREATRDAIQAESRNHDPFAFLDQIERGNAAFAAIAAAPRQHENGGTTAHGSQSYVRYLGAS